MRNEGDPKSSASHSPADSVEESKFTAVNNNNYNGNGNGGTIIVGRHAGSAPLPLLSAPSPRDSGITTGSTSGAASPRLVLPTVAEEQWRMHNRTASAVDAAGIAQKRKRSLERSVTPTTQTTHHHLAAHEAAAGADEQAAKIQQQYFRDQQQQAMRPDDRVGMGEIGHGVNYEEEVMRHDDGSTRAGTQEGSPQPGQDNRKRKRVFSNRTKTGCITCRRRKKKCDEGKPECSNCKRGGFVCEGYSGKVSWTKPPGKQNTGVSTPVNIQSKGEHPGSTSVSPSSNYVRPVHMIQNQIPHRVQVVEEVHRPQSPQPRGGINYQPRTGPIVIEDANDPPLSPELRQQPYPNDPSQQSPQLQSYPHGGPPNLPPAQGISTPGGHRRISFSQAAISAATGALQRQRSEKEKMINSELYYANCPELVEDRGRCKSACWRFNEAASNPTLGISRTEIGRLLLDVLRPEKEWEVVNSTTPHGQVTYMSQDGFPSDIVDVRVDAPFTCSYGYNIRLEKGVLIEFGCTILDSCSVTIKARTIISPNVSIYSATHPIDPRKRNGAQGPEMAKPVLIEEDCWLGGNVIVLGGITIGKGSVVGAGSVVTRDVPPFTVVAGNPARVIRGIYQNGIDM